MAENSTNTVGSIEEVSPVLTTASTVLASLINGTLDPFTLGVDSPDQHIAAESDLEKLNFSSTSTTPSYPFIVSSTPAFQGDYICDGHWLPVNHLYFQLANIFLFLSYLAPNGIYGILYLRITLCIGCFFFALWGYLILCALDTLLWNAAFVLINLVHTVIIAYRLRPVRFSNELEQVSTNNYL